MKCLECGQSLRYLHNPHLLSCCGLTLQEYAIRHHLPLDYLVDAELLGIEDSADAYTTVCDAVSDYDVSLLRGLQQADALLQDEQFVFIEGEIRRLDQLLWYQKSLQHFGFQFRQEYEYTQDTHRVVAKNRLKIPLKYYSDIHLSEPSAFNLVMLATLVAHIGEYRGGYLFLSLKEQSAQNLMQWLATEHQIRMVCLPAIEKTRQHRLLRSETLTDCTRLLNLIRDPLSRIPCAAERFFADVDEAMVSKELVFDAAHFITDHPGKCVNLHGGRYAMNVKVRGRIDPLNGFVIDYGFLKQVVKQLVIEQLDHHNLNYAASDLAWRSSTELLSIYIWERLIHYLPDLYELQIYETSQSYCVYRGPTLDKLQNHAVKPALKHFSKPELGKSALRSLATSVSKPHRHNIKQK